MFTDFNSVYDTDYYIVLKYLNPLDICRSAQVSKNWNGFLSENVVWDKYYSNIKLPLGIPLKQHFDTRAVISLNALMKRIKIFSNVVPTTGNGKFTCYFPILTKCHIALEILNKPNSKLFGVRELYWFMPTFKIEKSDREVFTLNKKVKGYFIHLRLPNNEYFKDTLEKIIKILVEHKNHIEIRAHTTRSSPKAIVRKSNS